MKFIHLSDLHIGKSLDRFRLIDDQKYILSRITEIISEEKPDAVLISGDVYDRGIPPIEAVEMLDEFLCGISRMNIPLFIISGNHDSSERLAFGRTLMEGTRVYISPAYNGNVEPIVLNDEFGEVYIYMLPFVKPAHVREALKNLYGNEEEAAKISTYTDAVAKAIELMGVNNRNRNILLSHQFVGNAVRCASETVSVGGADAVSPDVYRDFNYAALGHLHAPQTIKTDAEKNVLYYCGSPLKYSFSNEPDKSVAVVTLDAKGSAAVRRIPLTPMRDMRIIQGTYEQIMSDEAECNDFVLVVLDDKDILSHYFYDLRDKFPNLVSIDTKAARSEQSGDNEAVIISENESYLDIFMRFFTRMNDREMTAEETAHMSELIEKAAHKLNNEETGED